MAQRFGRFWLHEKIGQGGMAEVFRATIGPDPHTYAFDMALKRILPRLANDKVQVDMFLTEADVAKLLKHTNIVQMYESGIIENQAYIAMEYVWGLDLATLTDQLRKRRLRLPTDLSVYIVMQVLRALDYVHNATTPKGDPMEIVHRDVTPSNIYITYDGQVKLGDFGIARVNFLEKGEDPNVIKGKITYLPPEVLSGGQVDQRTDLWSLAVSFYEMLTARRLFDDISEDDMLSGRFSPRVLPAHKLVSDISPNLSKILSQALHPKIKKRPQDAVEFYRQLKAHLLDEGVQVDATALARFVGSATGARPTLPEPRQGRAPGAGVFEQPRFQVPVAMSPTQRIERRRKKRSGATAYLAIAGLLVLGLAIAVALRRSWRPAAPEAPVKPPVVAAPVVTPPTASPPPAAAPVTPVPARARPQTDATIDFAENLEPPEPEPALAQSQQARFAALMHRGQQQAKRKRFSSADDAYREALELRPKDVSAMLGRANVLIELQQYAEAERLVRAAMQQQPRNQRAYLLLGDVLWVQGKDKLAKSAYQRCYELDAGSGPGKIAKRILEGM